MTVVALVPAHRRSDRVGATVRALQALADEVVVVDDGSDDGGATVRAAADAGATVLVLPVNRGKGGALTAAVAATPHATIYLLIDADLAGTAGGAAPLLDALHAGADLAVGVLPGAGGRGGFGLVRRAAGWVIAAACGFRAVAPLSGQRAVRADLLRGLLPLADRFGVEVGMTIDAVRAGATVVEVPVGVDHRHTGRSLRGIAHRAGQGWDLLRAAWPRLADPTARLVLLTGAALVAVALLAAAATAFRTESVPLARADRVVLVAAPAGLRVEDVGSSALPTFSALAGRSGTVAAVQVVSDRRDPRSLWATVSAGERVEVPEGPDPRSPADEPFLVTGRVEGAGRLGGALAAAGRRTAFVGTSTSSAVRWASMDAQGRSASAATAASVGPSGMATRVVSDARTAALVVVDATEQDAAGFDRLLSELRRVDDGRTLLLVFGGPAPTGQLGLAPLVAAGPGAPAGRLTSPSTRRDGLVLATDVAPTVLSALGVPVPPGMTGRPVERIAGSPEIGRLARLDRLSRLRPDLWDPSILPLTLVQVALYAWARWRRPGPRGASRGILFVGSLAVAAWPLATWLVRALPGLDRSRAAAAVAALAVDALVVAAAHRIGRGRGLAPLALVLGATLAVVAVDLGAGGPLQLSSAFGYAASSSGRFTGLGNGGFAVIATAAAVLVGCAPRRAPWIPVLLLATTLVVGLPMLGNDVGGLLTLAPVSIVAVAVLWRRFRWPVVALAAILGVALVAVAGLADLRRSPRDRTHLGRFLAEGDQVGVLLRRTEVNLQGYETVPVLVPVVAVALWIAWSLARGRWTGLLPTGSAARVGAGAAVATALIGHAVNDSGPVVVGVACITIGPFLVLQALVRDQETALGP